MADGAVLVDFVLFPADDIGGDDAGQHQRQNGDPDVPAGAASRARRLYGPSVDHPLLHLESAPDTGVHACGARAARGNGIPASHHQGLGA